MTILDEKHKSNKELEEFAEKFGVKKEYYGFDEELLEEQNYYNKVKNITLVLKKLREDGMNIERYGYGVCHNILCLLTAFRNTLDAYKVIKDEWKTDEEVIYAYWTVYLEKMENNNPDYLNYYPNGLDTYLKIIKSLEENDDENKKTEVIHNIISELSDEEFIELYEYCNNNLAYEFINKDLKPHIANCINDYMVLGRNNHK